MFFVDFEASSLSAGSFPIEIGWVDEAGLGEAHLIKPESFWTAWDASSEAIHGISRATLATDGEDVGTVCGCVLKALSGAVLISDNPAFEQYWMQCLLDAGKISSSFVFEDFDKLCAKECLPLQSKFSDDRMYKMTVSWIINDALQKANRLPLRHHRAFDDAQRLRSAWQFVKDEVMKSVGTRFW